MKVDVDILRGFVNRASLNGEIPTINMDFREEGLFSAVKDLSGIAMTATQLSKEDFEEYEAIGELYIKNAPTLVKYLKSFKGMVGVELVDKFVLKIFNDAREAYIVLGSELIVDNKFEGEIPSTKTGEVVVMERDSSLKAVNDGSLIGESTVKIRKGHNFVEFTVGKIGNGDCFVNKIPVKTPTEEERVVGMGSYFGQFLNVISIDYEMAIETDKPIYLKEEDETMKFICVIAPRIDNE